MGTRTRLALVMHHREVDKPTATGPLALAALENAELHVHGLRDAPLNLESLHATGRRILVLFPREDAQPLSSALLQRDPRPVTLVVPDGNWRQASRIPRRVPGLQNVECVTLPGGPDSRWGVRREPRAGGLATLEAIARAFGILESPAVQATLETLLSRVVQATIAARGADPADAGKRPAVPRGPAAPLQVLHLDDHLLAVHKPAGMPSHRGWAVDGLPALQVARDQIGRHLFPVHRLDRATSGVLLFALHSEVARDIQAAFADSGVHKRYLALCRGHDPALRRIEHPLSAPDGVTRRAAATDLRLLGRFERYGLYEAIPEQGRTHQIRRHLKYAAHPIIGDVRYGKGEHNRIFRERFDFHRLALHCVCMRFIHPRSGDELSIDAGLPDDFAALLQRLDLAHLGV